METDEIKRIVKLISELNHDFKSILVDVSYRGREIVSYIAKLKGDISFVAADGETIESFVLKDRTIEVFVLVDFKVFHKKYRDWYYRIDSNDLLYKHCVYCNGIFKQNVPTQGYCSYYCKNVVTESIQHHNGQNLGMYVNINPIYVKKPSPELLAKYPNNINWFKNYLIEFKKGNGHLYWNLKEAPDLIRKEENRLVSWYKDGVLSQDEIEEYENIGWKWKRRERKKDMIESQLEK